MKRDELFLMKIVMQLMRQGKKVPRDPGSANINCSCQTKCILYAHPMFNRLIHWSFSSHSDKPSKVRSFPIRSNILCNWKEKGIFSRLRLSIIYKYDNYSAHAELFPHYQIRSTIYLVLISYKHNIVSTPNMHLSDKYIAYLKDLLSMNISEYKEMFHKNTGNIYLERIDSNLYIKWV